MSSVSVTSTQSRSKRTRFSDDSTSAAENRGPISVSHDDLLFDLFDDVAGEEFLGRGHDTFASAMEDRRVTRGGMRVEQSEPPKHCHKYLDYESFAERFVDNVLQESIDQSMCVKRISSMKIIEGLVIAEDEVTRFSLESAGTYVCVLEWPTIQDFTADVGLQKIHEFVSYWIMKENWGYCVNYLKGHSDEITDFYQYEVLYSIPCFQYPIAQVTASVYFTVEVSRVRPKNCLVDVSYYFEGSRLRHTPGKYVFQEVWLFDIVDAKINLFKTLDF